MCDASHIVRGMTHCIPLLAEIDRFLAFTGMRPTTFGLKALNDPHFIKRLRGGGDVKTATATKVREFMAKNLLANVVQG